MAPVHDAAKCKAQNCHHHGPAPLTPRDVPHPNSDDYPPHEVVDG